VVFRGAIDTEVFVRQLSGRPGWAVVSASSDMIVPHDVTYDGTEIQGRATPEADGELVISYHPVGQDPIDAGRRDARAREDAPARGRADRPGDAQRGRVPPLAREPGKIRHPALPRSVVNRYGA